MLFSCLFDHEINLFFFSRFLAQTYSTAHPRMSNPATPGCDEPESSFAKQGGITNGAAWYSVAGGNFCSWF